jgi:hypothetical protein
MTWHADTTLLRRYASAQLSDAGMASVEMHVTSCPSCRTLVVAQSDGARCQRVKQMIDERLDTPGIGWGERSLLRTGLDERDARLISATLSLHGSWLAACVLALAFAALATSVGPERAGLAAFLVAAPLVPLLGVALAFGARVDPTYEIATAASLPTTRIILLRTLAVTGPTMPVLAFLSLLLPAAWALSFAWLLPAAGLAVAALALGTVMSLNRAAVGLATLWLVGATIGFYTAPRTSAEAFAKGFAAFRPSGQLLFVALGVASIVLVALRRGEFETVR